VWGGKPGCRGVETEREKGGKGTVAPPSRGECEVLGRARVSPAPSHKAYVLNQSRH